MNYENFESHFGLCAPKKLIEFSHNNGKDAFPCVFKIEGASFILGIQYLLDINNPENYDVKNGRVSFAVTTDGFNLMVDIRTNDLEIFQDEYGDIDSLDINLTDLVRSDQVA